MIGSPFFRFSLSALMNHLLAARATARTSIQPYLSPAGPGSVERSAAALLCAVNEAGGLDIITVVVVEVLEGELDTGSSFQKTE
jgi:hypothetical protein